MVTHDLESLDSHAIRRLGYVSRRPRMEPWPSIEGGTFDLLAEEYEVPGGTAKLAEAYHCQLEEALTVTRSSTMGLMGLTGTMASSTSLKLYRGQPS
jgi:hypothetical protein